MSFNSLFFDQIRETEKRKISGKKRGKREKKTQKKRDISELRKQEPGSQPRKY